MKLHQRKQKKPELSSVLSGRAHTYKSVKIQSDEPILDDAAHERIHRRAAAPHAPPAYPRIDQGTLSNDVSEANRVAGLT